MKNRGLLIISPELLLELLKVEDATILDIRTDQFAGGQVEILLDSPKMPICEEGAHPRIVILEVVQSGYDFSEPPPATPDWRGS